VKIYSHHVVFSVAIMLLMQVVTTTQENTQQQMPAASSLVTSSRPLAEAAVRLQETYGKVVTYEEPVLTWRGELEGEPNRDPEGKWALFPRKQAFFMPAEIGIGTDLDNVLEHTVAAYHQQTSGTRFQVLSSKLGYHIVPVQVHDENGRSVSTTSVPDHIVTVPAEARTAMQHLDALGAAISSTGSIRVVISAVPYIRPGGFDNAFRAQPEVFQWGVHSVVARDALVDLFNQSATTFSWHLKCQASAQPSDRFCVLNVGMLEVVVTNSQGKPVTDSQGKPVKQVLKFDRCRDCPPEIR